MTGILPMEGQDARCVARTITKSCFMKANLFGILLFSACCAMEAFSGLPSDELYNPPLQRKEVTVTKDVVKLFPNPTYTGSISVSNNGAGELHFYIFDLDGTMIHQSVLKQKQKRTVSELQKGVYVYDVFKDDVSIENGKIVVK